MRKGAISLAAFGLLAVTGFGFAYQQQGFLSYEEKEGQINFQCKAQCVINLGAKWSNNLISLNHLKGNGTIIAGVMNGTQFVPISQQTIQEGQTHTKLSLISPQLAGPGLENIQINLVINGDISWNGSTLSFVSANFIDKIGMGWKEYRAKEGQTFYGINLRYGQKILGTSVVVYWYWICVLGLIYLYFKKRLSFAKFLSLAFLIYLCIAIRNQIDYTQATSAVINSYTQAPEWSKTYGNLGDFYEYVAKARKEIKLDDGTTKTCKAYYECAQERPFCVHMWTVFIKPCEKTDSASTSDYQLYYKKTPTNPVGTKIVDFNWSFVYKTK